MYYRVIQLGQYTRYIIFPYSWVHLLKDRLYNPSRSINDEINFLPSDIIRRSQENMIASRAVNRAIASIYRNAVCRTQACLLDTRCDVDLGFKWLLGRLVFDEFDLFC